MSGRDLSDQQLVAVLSVLLADGVPQAVSDFERKLVFEVIDRFNAEPMGFAMTGPERTALDDLLAGLKAAHQKASA
ncbi:MAG: hypothetical protein GC145_18725 [Caulobacter sp.]|nr:hypothetical protein [Caulobacter sp.]